MSVPTSKKNSSDLRLAWFNHARFGIFVHWGLYSILGRGEWVMFKEKIPADEYARLADRFNPARFDADAWAALAREAGARYMVLTTRHHDGFCLFDSRASDFTSVKTGARRDFIREYAAACRRAGLKVGFYYSLCDWRFPGFYAGPRKAPKSFEAMVQQAHDQVEELMTRYGKVDVLWYDGAPVPGVDLAELAGLWRSRQLNAMVRRFQPHILINNRSSLDEDFSTPEQHATPPVAGRAWESCMTIGRGWGYTRGDRPLKSATMLIRTLVHAAQWGGNLLLNIGPHADGTIPAAFTRRLQTIGDWMAVHGESVYGSQRCPLTETLNPIGPVTVVGRRVYVHFQRWRGRTVAVAGIGRVRRARLLSTGADIRFRQTADGRVILGNLPARLPDRYDSVVALTTDRSFLRRRVLRLLQQEPVGPHDPPAAPFLTARELLVCCTRANPRRVISGTRICPGWQDTEILEAPAGRLDLTLDVPADGLYDLRLGLVVSAALKLQISRDGQSLVKPVQMDVAGYPDTAEVPGVKLRAGRCNLSLSAVLPFGLYGSSLKPHYRPLPSHNWAVIGPFPSFWDIREPDSKIRRAFETVYPPEREIRLSCAYAGVAGRLVRWTRPRSDTGAHASVGVNFTTRLKPGAKGLGYAVTFITSPTTRPADLLVACDWWANAYLNRQRVRSIRERGRVHRDGAEFSTTTPIPARVMLRRGLNTLLVKCHRGMNSHWFTAAITDPGDLKISSRP